MDSYSTTTVGLMPRLFTPATALWALPFGAYLILLSGRIFAIRIATQTLLGDHIEAPPSPPPTASASKTEPGKTDVKVKTNPADNPDQLYLATRCMANYLDTVPIAMIFSLIAELNGADHKVLSCALGTFFAIKIIHIEFGLRCAGTMGLGRPIGYLSGLVWLASMASYCVYLSKDYWLA